MKESELVKISNPATVKRKFAAYAKGDDAKLMISNRSDKKYKVIKPDGTTVHFGSTLEDYTKHGDDKRRAAYLKRSGAIKGDWRSDKYSPNSLARALLW
jgi:hypothetical protein